MKKTLIFTLWIFGTSLGSAFAQIHGNGGTPNGFKFSPHPKNFKEINFQTPNLELLRAEDELVDGKGVAPWRFGFVNETSLNFLESASKIDLGEVGILYQLMLTCTDAKSINLLFTNTTIPDGNQLFVYNPDKSFILGSYSQNWIYEGELGTELIPGSSVVVEYFVSSKNRNNLGEIHISKVVHGYRSATEFIEKGLNTSGSCNMNVNCPDGAAWQNQINSAVMLVSGSNGFCSGALINNTASDGKPYVLTANHCYSNPASWIFRFNWQAPSCANPITSPTFQSLSGAVLRARRTPSDMCLVEITGGLINGTVPATYNVYFSGWNNSNTAPTSTVSIHHPDGDIKKISFDDNASTAVQAMSSTEANSSWRVVWDRNTTTEGGSSGSPLFDQNKRIIGQLWGGQASCSNLTGPDYYGRLHNSWNPSGSNATNQLKNWLDPANSGVEFIDGYDPNMVNNSLDAKLEAINSPVAGSASCNSSITPSVTIKNNGTNVLTSAIVSYRLNNNAWITQNWTGNLASLATATITFPSVNGITGLNTFVAKVSNPNNGTDLNLANDSLQNTFTVINNTPTALPLMEGFEGAFVPANWTLVNPDNGITWAKFNTGMASNNSVRVNNFAYTNASNVMDELITPFFSLQGAVNPMLKFDVAYAAYSSNTTYHDGLRIDISSNCGASWNTLYNKSGTALATVANNTNTFVPNSSSWRADSISLNSYIGNASLQIRFVSISNYGNNLYLDNINIKNKEEVVNPGVSVHEEAFSTLQIWPNPSNDVINISLEGSKPYSVALYNSVGQKLGTTNNHAGIAQIQVSNLSAGVYFVEISVEGNTTRKKIIVH